MTLEEMYPSLALLVVFTVMAGQFDNHLWRMICIGLLNVVTKNFVNMWWPFYVVTVVIIWWIPMFANLKYNKRQGCVLITGCDSGMGQATAVYLAKTNDKKTPDNCYDQIFAACFNAKTSQAYFEKELSTEQMKFVTVVPMDVTNNESVQQARQTIEEWMKNISFLSGMVQFHGIAYNGPAQYMPIEFYERQLQVNFVGYLRVVQQFLPLLRSSEAKQKRMVFTGTGGGPCTPCPPLLTAYMASKFATEAYCSALRQELSMTSTGIEACMINPGFVKPTMLMEEGKKLTDKMWVECEKRQGSSIAKEEFKPLMDHFVEYSALQPGTHVSKICEAAEHALLAPVPRTSYKVGIDSKLAPIVGMLPTGVREKIANHGIYGVLSPTGTIKGYKL